VVFEPTSNISDEERILPGNEPMAHQLEEELIRLKEKLRTSNEQHEYQAEELKASNEELQAMNEELRSAAEELETSREELQSINEELTTVNQELKIRVEEVSYSNNNLQNLINSTDIGTASSASKSAAAWLLCRIRARPSSTKCLAMPLRPI
jgi:two-component system CheB/CheR fusion protein